MSVMRTSLPLASRPKLARLLGQSLAARRLQIMTANVEFQFPVQAVDDDSFAALLAFHAVTLHRYAARLSQSAADADDLMQDVCLKCWGARHRFAIGTNFLAWARTIMRNSFFTSLKRYGYQVDLADETIGRLAVSAPAQLVALELKEVMSALDHLDAGHRHAVVMASEGVSLEQGAAILKIPVNTYKSWVRRGRRRLGRLLDGTEQPPQRSVLVVSPGAKTLASDIKVTAKRPCAGVMIG